MIPSKNAHFVKKLFYSFLILFAFCAAYAQKPKQSGAISQIDAIDKQLKDISKNINERKGNQKQQERQLAELKAQSERLGYDKGTLRSGDLIMLLYGLQNRYKETIKLGSELKKIAQGKTDPNGSISSIYRRNALALGYLGLDDASIKDFKTAISAAKTIENNDLKSYYLALCYENMTVYYENRQFDSKFIDSLLYYRKMSLNEAKKIKDNNGIISNDLKYDQIAYGDMAIGVSYLSKADTKGNIELAEKYLLEGLAIHENKGYNIPHENKITMLNQLSWLYSEKQDYQKSVDYALSALKLEKQFRNPRLRVESFEFLADSYMGLGKKEKAKFYMDKYTYLKDSLNIAAKNNADDTMKNMVADVDNKYKDGSKKQLIIAGMLLLIIIIATISYVNRKNKLHREKYEDLIAKINSKKDDSAPRSTSAGKIENNDLRSTIVPETANALLQKLEKFEASEKYLKKEANLTWLANQLNTNTKYLSEIIKIYRGKNFSNYLNGLRINYIVHKLYNEPKYREYKINHLVEECGFGTYKVFVVAFKNEHGVTPSYFIQNLRKDQA